MSESPVDLFVLTLPDGVSVRMFDDDGLLDQQRPMLRRLAKHYRSIAVVGRGEESIGKDDPDGFVVFDTNDDPTPRLLQAVPGATTAVVRTHQLDHADRPVRLVASLRDVGLHAALIARGGYLHSRFVARRQGSDSPHARAAADAERRLCAHADFVIGTTGVMVDDLAWRWRLPSGRTRVVPNFVDDGPDPVGAADRDRGMVLSVGGLSRQKRMDRIVEAVGAMPAEARSALRVVIVGRGDRRDELIEQAKQAGVELEIADRMSHAELRVAMNQASMYLQASAYEGHPLPLIEAMSTGCPAIVANSPGLGTLVENGVNGIVVPGTAESISYALAGVLEDEGWREMMGSAACTSARRRFGLTTVFDSELDAQRAALRFASRGDQAAA